MTISVFSASAGSGKTHHLTYEYLKLVLSETNNFRHILAITFTNKATEEMKIRIIQELHLLASGQNSKMLNQLLKDFPNQNETTLRIKASDVLKNILYTYHFFNISTIDSFFQQIMRIFTRELGIQAAYNIQLDTQAVIEEAILNMLKKTGINPQLTAWIYEYIESRISEGKNWNFRKGISELGIELVKEHFNEYFSDIINFISNHEKINDYLKKLNIIIKNFEQHQVDKSLAAMKIITLYNLTIEDYSYGVSGVAGWLNKLSTEPDKIPGNRVIVAVTENKGWYSEKTPQEIKQLIEEALNNGLKQLTAELYQFYNEKIKEYNTAKLIKNYFFVIGLSAGIIDELSQIREEKNILMLQDVNVLLSKLISTNDVPFIYERTGNWLNYLFIDEFQDTSLYQWNNLLPILRNNLASGYNNLIVGDVKQSIYRWRDDDWSLMLKKIYEQFDNESIKSHNLDYNFRSSKEIIDFNNELFKVIPGLLTTKFTEKQVQNDVKADETEFSDIIKLAYKKAFQQIPENSNSDEGFVKAIIIPDEKENSWKTKALEKLYEQISLLFEKGYRANDITILVRRHQEGKEIASFLMHNFNFNIVSKEVISFSNSIGVSFLICSLKYLNNPADNFNIAELLFYQHQLLPEADYTQIPEFLNDKSKKISQWLSFLDELKNSYTAFSLYDLCEKMIHHSKTFLISNEKVYLQAFLNLVLENSYENKQDIRSFIDFWEETGKNKNIPLPEINDGINIMTIHKSKGLQFKLVIIPFCDWEIDHKSVHENILWCKPEQKPFDELPIVPVRYNKMMENSFFRKEYFEEKIYAYMDNLNALYVAFTRAEKGLMFFSPAIKKDEFDTTGKMLHFILKGDILAEPLNQFYNNEEMIFMLGEINLPKTDVTSEKTIAENEFISNLSLLKLKPTAFTSSYIYDSGNLPLEHGKFMHHVLSKIATVKDIDSVLLEIKRKGAISELEVADLGTKLTNLLKNKYLSDWFSDKYKSIRERQILNPGHSSRIPDRVMISDDKTIVIDFKFSEPQPSYSRQITEYMQLLKSMNYPKVEGFLVYCNHFGEVHIESFL